MSTEPTVPIAELELFCNGLDHAEGICVTAAGTIYVGGEAGQIYRVENDGTPTEVHSTDGFLLGLACDAHGAIYAVDVTPAASGASDSRPARRSGSSRASPTVPPASRTGAPSMRTATTTCPTPATGARATA